MAKAIKDLIEEARQELSKLTGLKLSSIVGAKKDGKVWNIAIEMVEKQSIPDQMDILATYESHFDEEGHFLGFERKRMRKRMQTLE